MAGDNVLGSVSIVITGDQSRLQADFAKAQATAQTSGAQIASALTSALAPGMAGATKLVDQFGRAIQTTTTAALPPVLNLNAGIQRLILAQELLAQAAAQTTPAIRQQSEAMGHSVTQIQAVSGAIRTLDGNQGIRAAERFLTMIPGIGAALQLAFPVIGAIAFFEIIARGIGKINELSEAEKSLAETTKANNAEWEQLATKFEAINVERMTVEFGKLAGLRLKGIYDKAAADRDRIELASTAKQITDAKKTLADTEALYSPNIAVGTLQALNPLITGMRLAEKPTKDQIATIKELTDSYSVLEKRLSNYDNQAALDLDLKKRTAAEQGGALTGAGVSNREQALAADTEARKRNLEFRVTAAHAAAQIEINAISDVDTKTLRSAQEALTAARAKEEGIVTIENAALPKRIALINAAAAAEAAGKDKPTQERIGVQAAGRRGQAGAESQARLDEAYAQRVAKEQQLADTIATLVRKQANDYSAVWDEAFSKIDDAAIKQEDAVTKAAEANAVGRVRVIETGDKSAGATGELAIVQQKLLAERAYGLEVVHTGAQQVAYAQQIATLDSNARAAKITGLQAELATAVANSKDVDADEKVATLKAEIAKLSAESANDDIAAQTKILELIEKQTLQYQLRAAFVKAGEAVPGAIGGGIAAGLFHQGKGGVDVGKQVGDALKNVGKDLLGTVLTDAIHKLLEQIVIQTGLQTIFNAIFPPATTAQVTATTANTAAVTANTLAQLKSAAGGIAGAAGGVGSSAAGAAGSAASSAATGLTGPLIAAAGGIIGGVISAVSTWIGDNKIVKAVNATTAAVQALHGTVTTTTANQTSSTPTLTSSTAGASQGGFAGFFASILGLGGAKPVDVNIVAISPISPLKGLANLFGFAGGGRPPVGVASIVGEHGPELFLPDQPGRIYPAGTFASAALQLPAISGGSSTSSSHSFSIGEVHLHGVQDVRAMMRGIAGYAKNANPQFSPFASK